MASGNSWLPDGVHSSWNEQPAIIPSSVNNDQMLLWGHISWYWNLDTGASPQSAVLSPHRTAIRDPGLQHGFTILGSSLQLKPSSLCQMCTEKRQQWQTVNFSFCDGRQVFISRIFISLYLQGLRFPPSLLNLAYKKVISVIPGEKKESQWENNTITFVL